jgi:plasmid stability protein
MPDITIHDVPQVELDALDSRGARHGRSREGELRQLIHEAASEELLVTELERASEAVERLKAVEKAAEREVGPAVGTASPPRRRYRHQPTPRSAK